MSSLIFVIDAISRHNTINTELHYWQVTHCINNRNLFYYGGIQLLCNSGIYVNYGYQILVASGQLSQIIYNTLEGEHILH